MTYSLKQLTQAPTVVKKFENVIENEHHSF